MMLFCGPCLLLCGPYYTVLSYCMILLVVCKHILSGYIIHEISFLLTVKKNNIATDRKLMNL